MSLPVSQEFSNQIERWNRSQAANSFKISPDEIQEITVLAETVRNIALSCLSENKTAGKEIQHLIFKPRKAGFQNCHLGVRTDFKTNHITVYLRTPSGKLNTKYTPAKKLQKGYQLNFSFTRNPHDLKLIDFKPVTILRINNSSHDSKTFETNRALLRKEINVTQKLQTVAGVCRLYNIFSYEGKQKYLDASTQSLQTKKTTKLDIYQEYQGLNFEEILEVPLSFRTNTIHEFANSTLYNLALILNEIHSKDVTHNNISPNTVFFRSSTQPGNADTFELFLADFEFARDSVPPHEINHQEELKADPEYCCNEHTVLHRAAQPANDIWSLGTLIVKILNNDTGWGPFLKLFCRLKSLLQHELFDTSRQIKADEALDAADAEKYVEGFYESLKRIYNYIRKIDLDLCADLNGTNPKVADKINSFLDIIAQNLKDFDTFKNGIHPQKLAAIKIKLIEICMLMEQKIPIIWERLDEITPPKTGNFKTEYHNVFDYIIWGMLRPFACHRITSADIVEWLEPFIGRVVRGTAQPTIEGSEVHSSRQLLIDNK